MKLIPKHQLGTRLQKINSKASNYSKKRIKLNMPSYNRNETVGANQERFAKFQYEEQRRERNKQLLKEAKKQAEMVNKHGYPIYDRNGNIMAFSRTPLPQEKPLSGTDPLGELYVSTVALNPAFKLAGRALQYPLAKMGNQTARNAIMARKFNYAADKAFGFDGTKSVSALGSGLLYEGERPRTSLVVKPTSSEIPTPRWKGFEYTLKNQPKEAVRKTKISTEELSGKPKGARNNTNGVHPDSEYGNFRFIRNINGLPYVDEEGMVHLANDKVNLLANFSTDLPFRLHPHYPDAPGSTYMIVSPRAFKGKKFLSLDPGDSFMLSDEAIVNPNFVRIISGDPEVLNQAARLGMRTTTSPKLQKLYKIGTDAAKKEFELGLNGGQRSFMFSDRAAGEINLHKRLLGEDAYQYPKEGVVVPYRNEVDRIITDEIGRPSLEDYRRIQKITNVDPHISSTFNEEFLRNASDPLATQNMFRNVYYNATPSIEDDLMRRIGLYSGPRQNFNSWMIIKDNFKDVNPFKYGGKLI